MKNIIIICAANKTRSVMAMNIANHILWVKGVWCASEYSFKSAGITPVGGKPDGNVARVLEEAGIIVAEHVPVSIDEFDLTSFDEIHVMNLRQKITLCSHLKELDIADKITVLNIDDPFAKGIDAYRACREKLTVFYKRFIV